MKNRRVFLAFFFLFLFMTVSSQAWRKWEYVLPSDIDITIVPEKTEIVSGDVATFTITIRNKTDKPVSIFFPTGQRWDMAAYHSGTQIWRWSQGLQWAEAPHSIDIRPGFPESFKLSWKTIDRVNAPLPTDIYRVQGMVMTKPRYLMSNMADIRLLPPRHPKMNGQRVMIDKTFTIELPRYKDRLELDWKPQYVFNDNRIQQLMVRRVGKSIIFYFKACRRGHVVVQMHGFDPEIGQLRSIERRTYRFEIVEEE